MDHEGKIYEQVNSSSEDEMDIAQGSVSRMSALHTGPRHMFYLVLILLALLVGSNGLWIKQWTSSSQEHVNSIPDHSIPASLPFHFNTDFSSDNKSDSNKLWKDLFPAGDGLVSVSTTFAKENQFPASLTDPENANHSLYLTAAFHQLHCVTVLRASIYRYHEGANQTAPWIHLTHCLDTLRQALMCNLDNTLLYSEDGNIWGDGQTHVCRDWEGLVNWVEGHAKIRD